MRILILGATGFIGNSIFLSLVPNYKVIIASRKPMDGYKNWKFIDFLQKNDWDEILESIDLVINCIGIIDGDFNMVQTKSPISLYEHCAQKKIKIIHVSAIGAEEEKPISDFLQSKKLTDTYLLKHNDAIVIYPGIVLGSKGRSAQFFKELASLPILPLMKMDNMPFVHINQLTSLVQDIIANFNTFPKQIVAFGTLEPFKRILESLKGGKVRIVQAPNFIFVSLFKIFPKINIGIFNKTTFALSQQDLTKKHQPIFGKVSKLINSKSIERSNYIFEILALLTISFVWVWSGVSSLISWDISLQLMEALTDNIFVAKFAIYLGSILDIVLGVLLFFKKIRKPIIQLQLIFIVGYMLLLSIYSPYFWLHPFGVLSKNIPLIILSYHLLSKK